MKNEVKPWDFGFWGRSPSKGNFLLDYYEIFRPNFEGDKHNFSKTDFFFPTRNVRFQNLKHKKTREQWVNMVSMIHDWLSLSQTSSVYVLTQFILFNLNVYFTYKFELYNLKCVNILTRIIFWN